MPPTAVTQMPTSSKMTLSSIVKGVERTPDAILALGTEGVGKSTFAADAPNPIFICAENGSSKLNVARFPTPETFQDVLEALSTLERESHDYKTVVLDTIDWVGHLIQAEVCRRQGWTAEDFEKYGRGLKVWVDDWRKLLLALDRLRFKRGMEVILLAHVGVVNFKNPAGEDYMRYQPKIAGQDAPALLKEWAESVLFMAYEEMTVGDTKRGKVKGVATGNRIIHTQRTAAWDAKNRLNLPPAIPLVYGEYAAFREQFYAGKISQPTDELVAACHELIEELGNTPEANRAKAFVESKLDDGPSLLKALDRLKALVANQKKES